MSRAVLTQAEGPAHTQILGMGGVRGENVVTNDDIAGPIDSSDEWIRQRTGIITRRRANAETDVLDLAEGAARAALADSRSEERRVGQERRTRETPEARSGQR